MNHAAARARGFTLIEVLVALTVLALLALMSWQGLSQAVDLRTRLSDDLDTAASVASALGQLERDIAQRLPDAALRDGTLGALPASVRVEVGTDGGMALHILRTTPSTGGATYWQAVRYVIENGTLVRHASVPDWTWAPASATAHVEFDHCGSAISVRGHLRGTWLSFPLAPGTPALNGLEITFECDTGSRYTRYFAL